MTGKPAMESGRKQRRMYKTGSTPSELEDGGDTSKKIFHLVSSELTKWAKVAKEANVRVGS